MSQLLTILTSNFSREELKTLAFDLDVDFDEFPDKGKTSQARDLIQYLQRRRRLGDLITLGRPLRPNVDWPTPDALLEGKRIEPVAPQLLPYLEMAMRRYGRIPLSPLDPSGRESARVSLAQVFVNLDAGRSEYARYPADDPQKMVSEQYSAALAHVHENPQLILLGDPGSGKSTLLRYLAYHLALAALEPDTAWLAHLKWNHTLAEFDRKLEGEARLAELPEQSKIEIQTVEKQWTADAPLPVYVELRNFAQTEFDPASPQALWQYVCRQLEKDDLAEAIPALKPMAQQGQVIFLFDGVDEVPVERRPQVWQAIAAMSQGVYGSNRWVTTCRILSFAAAEAPVAVPVQTLQPLSEAQIDRFISGWYTAVTDELGESKAASMTQHLQAASRRPRIRPLAQNPMLLTIMAIVQTYHGTLPEERARLYQICVETLLLRWQHSKEMPDVLAQLSTTQENLERLLREIAWQAHSRSPDREDAADIPEMEVLGLARQYLGSFSQAEQFLEYTERRAHLLVGRGGQAERVYTFPHRTFQEYLAACHLASERRFGRRAAELAAEGDAWREVLALAVGTLVFNRSNQEKALDAIEQVLPDQTPSDDNLSGWYRVWMAGEMMLVVGQEAAEKDEVGRELLPRLRLQLAALLERGRLTPVQRAEAGVALGWLGDPRPDVACEIPALVEISAGPFLMGSDKKADEQAYNNEGPQHTLDLPVYAIGKYPVTVAQYRCFVEAGGYDTQEYWTEVGWEYRQKEGWTEPYYWQDPRWTVPNHPVVGVSWYEAVAYCNWLRATTGDDYCLPSEAMWEKAARGSDGRIYPWGNKWNPANLNARETGIGQTSAVGMFLGGRSPAGVFDLSGNIWEWTSDWFGSYPYVSAEDREYPEGRTEWIERVIRPDYVMRSGAWSNFRHHARIAFRLRSRPDSRSNVSGFRVVRRSLSQ